MPKTKVMKETANNRKGVHRRRLITYTSISYSSRLYHLGELLGDKRAISKLFPTSSGFNGVKFVNGARKQVLFMNCSGSSVLYIYVTVFGDY